MGKIKHFLKSHPKLAGFIFACYNALPFNNKVKGKRRNKLTSKGVMKKCKIYFKGKNNSVEIASGVILKNTVITVSGDNNRIIFCEKSFAKCANICTENCGNSIVIGKRTALCGTIHLAAIEGTDIIIGDDCLFSSEIVFRTGDSHSILNLGGERINPSKSIKIGDHVWVGHKVSVTKGVEIAKDNIVGTGAIVTKSMNQSNTVIAGVPAKVVKTDVNWDSERK